jgi:CRISPR-associated endonuclease/helicase Cas3
MVHRLWAKFDQETNSAHPLICHMLDSGNVFTAIWDEVLTQPFKKQFQKIFDLNEGQTKRALHFLISLHDIGKASAAFQSSIPEMKKLLEDGGLPFPKRSHYSPQRHDLISLWILRGLLIETGFCSSEDADMLSSVLGGHHGFFHSPSEICSSHCSTNLAGDEWKELQGQVFTTLKYQIEPPYSLILKGDMGEIQSLLVMLTGLVVVCDWLSSDSEFFPYQTRKDFPLKEYQEISRKRAHEVLAKTGWISWKPEGAQVSFFEMFHFETPNPIQKAVIEHGGALKSPFLAILEAPTGQGKTEAAFYLADKAIQDNSLRGMYVAMPTMATSNQMFGRTLEFLLNRYPQNLVNLQLAHSQAQWEPAFQSITMDAVGQDLKDREQGVAAMSWFLPKKRTLLAPFGVGTVDQALISILQTKHFFLRLFGLSHKVVIFDEVHAYDVYMSELFFRLLGWLKMLGCSVIILSATLPQKMKKRIAEVYSGNSDHVKTKEYPSFTFVDEATVYTIAVDADIKQHYQVEYIDNDLAEIVEYLASYIEGEGCAAVICNTVNKAQNVYTAIKNAELIDPDKEDEDLILFHARYPYLWRQEKEKKVLDYFGKNGKRPRKAILVATQVIEQSLDLDFDLMVSELAPIDLLIQRAGRLHRHIARKRPEKLAKPRFCIAFTEKNGDAEFGIDKLIYDEDILLATYFAFKGKNTLSLPEETRLLIEKVYNCFEEGVFTGEQLDRIAKSHEKSLKEHNKEKTIARSKLIPRADDERILQIGNMYLEEDHPEIHQAFQALTRLILPSVSLVCLIEDNGRYYTLDRRVEIFVDSGLQTDVIELLLKSSVNVARWPIINHFTQNVTRPQPWQKNAALRNSFPAIFHNGICKLNERISLVLDKELGLQYKEAR